MAGELILIVDDTPVNLKLARLLLVNEGFQVQTAKDAEEALDMLPTCRPSLLLLDIRLPGMSGLELARHLRRDPSWKNLPIVALTANAMKGDEQEALAAGCDGYVTKPVDTRTLPAMLRRHIESRRPRPQPVSVPEPPPPVQPEPDPALEPPPVRVNFPGLEELRTRFLSEGAVQIRHIIGTMGPLWDRDGAQSAMHQWVGAASLLGCTEISQLASRGAILIRDGARRDDPALRDTLKRLESAFGLP